MSGNIIINPSTTVEQLHEQVYNTSLDFYAKIYEQLMIDYPEYQELIGGALEYTTKADYIQSPFRDFMNGEIARIYSEMAVAAFGDDSEDTKPILDEL
ncbi:MAG: hypothetical protein ACRC9R_13035 [Enterovibrio sp.]